MPTTPEQIDLWRQAPSEHFPRMDDLWGTLEDFMRYCNVTLPPHIDRGLFS
jgi:hypothetical protein